MADSNLTTQKQQVFDYVNAFLGGGMVDVELDPIHYETGLQKALTKYRQRSENSVEESYVTIKLNQDQNVYELPQEIIEVRKIYRRSVGSRLGGSADGGSLFEPFNLAYTNTYLLAGSGIGGLATYDFYSQYVELSAKMFGGYLNYTFNPVTKKLQLIRRPRGSGENVLLWTYNLKPEITLLQDYQISQWIRDFMVGSAKLIIGEAREKFASIAGPQGGTTLNGSAMKAEGQQIMDVKIEELKNYIDGSQPLTFVIG